jgi:hypothetical protein
MPNAIFIEYEKQQKAQERVIRERAERQAAIDRAKAEAAAEKNRPKAGPLPPPPTNIDQLYDPIFKYDQPKSTISLATFASNSSYYTHLGTNDNVSSFRNYYYLATGQDRIRLNNQRTGLYLTRDSKNFTNFIPGDVKQNHPQPVVLNTKLLEDRATFADNKTFLAVAQLAFNSNFQFSNTFLAPYIKSSNLLQSLLGTDYYFALDAREVNSLGGWVDINLSSKESITNDINNTIKFRSKQFNTNAEDIDQISFVYTYQQPINDNDENRYRQFYFIFNITKSSNQSWNSSLRILQNWLSSSQPIWNITDLFSVNYQRDNTAGIATLLNNLVGLVLPAGLGGIYSYRDLVISGPLQLQPDPDTGLTPTIKFTTNDPNYITQVLTRPPATVAIGMDGNLGGGGNTFVFINNSTAEQKDEAQKFASALHAMLYAVKSEVQTQAEKGSLKNKSGSAVSILKITKDFFVDGILYGVLDSSTSTASDSGTPFKVIPYARKGFNSALMIDPDKFNKISDIDFNALCTAYYIKFKIENNTNPYNYPVYIKFGYLLAFLNSMCLIYDSKQDTDKRPYVYLDFHPEYNFCLTTPYHLSVDPLTCMIPYQGTDQQYKELFPKDIVDTVFTAKNPPLTKDNPISKFLTEFKNEKNVYQGKTMEILLSVDFLLNTLKSFTTNDATHTINLKGFLDAVVVGINKSCGNINMFRVSYDDDSNTVVIKDDQFVPNRSDEPNTLSRPGYTSTSNVDPMYGMIPIFGLNSMIREFEFKTNINTAMSKQIAISAQRTPDAVNSTDHTSYSYLNRDFEDAYKPQVTDSTKLTSAAKTETDKKAVSNDVEQAKKFNSHIFAIYRGNGYLNAGRIDFAINYYINSMADRKSLDLTTQSAQFISANLNMTIDGISGIVMGNAFTIPEDRLPRSLRGNGVQTKVGFIVSGLMHTLDNNQWLTKIKGQMIRLQEVKRKQTVQQNITKPPTLATTVVPVVATTDMPECPDFNPQFYSGAPLVPVPNSINTQNVKEYYPDIKFVRGTSNIPVRDDIPLLNENEIIDDTRFNRFDLGILNLNEKRGYNINYTSFLSTLTVKEVYDREFYCMGNPANYVIDKQGNIHRFMPDGTKNLRYKGNNQITILVMGDEEDSVFELQKRNIARLLRYLGANTSDFNKEFVYFGFQKIEDYITSIL